MKKNRKLALKKIRIATINNSYIIRGGETTTPIECTTNNTQEFCGFSSNCATQQVIGGVCQSENPEDCTVTSTTNPANNTTQCPPFTTNC